MITIIEIKMNKHSNMLTSKCVFRNWKKSNDYVIGICSYSMFSSSPIPHEWHMQYVDENKKDKIQNNDYLMKRWNI